jgi:putative ABC transport system permease protein
MIRNYFLTTLRNFKRNKIYSLINIIGLAVGLALFILISRYASFEFSFDKFHPNYQNICRVELDFDGKGRLVGITYNGMAATLVNDYPEIKEATRFINMGGRQNLVLDDNSVFPQLRGLWAESSIFSVFGFKLLQGEPGTVLSAPYTIVLTKELAERIFPDQNPIGKTIRLNDETEYKITGVVEDCPENSHIQFQFLGSFITQNNFYGEGYTESWERASCYTYVLLEENTALLEINEKIKNLIKTHVNEWIPSLVYLKPLHDIHFHSNVLGEFGPLGDLKQVKISLAIGLFVLLIACINFMNLATARSTQRAKEVGLRKVMGAYKNTLIIQHLCESLFFALVAMFMAIILAELLLTIFNDIIGRKLTLNLFKNWTLLLQILLITFLVGIFSGSYPAFFLSSFQPISVLKEGFSPGARGHLIRRILVVFQFTISTFLIFGTLIINAQMHFIKHKDLGLCTEHILVMSMRDAQAETLRKCELFQKELLNIPAVQNVTISRFDPSFNGAATVIGKWETSTEGNELYTNINWIDHRYLDSYKIELLTGRNFFETTSESEINNCLINEAAARSFGWEAPIGKTIADEITVIGLVKDFHFASLRYKIEPLILYNIYRPGTNPRVGNQLSIRVSSNQIDETIHKLESLYKEIFPSETFQYQFLDEQMQRIYLAEQRTSRTVAYLSLIAIFIACLGLYGLASSTIEQHTKEIGIRKVLGSTITQNVFLFSKEFAKWVLLANLIAWPLAGFAMHKWLQDFAYRTQLSWWVFLLSGFITFSIAILTVSYQTIRAALVNPVECLRYE